MSVTKDVSTTAPAHQQTERPAETMPARPRFRKLKIFLLIFAVVLAAFAGVVAMQPPDFKLSRSTLIDGSPEAVFAQVNDFHNWSEWSPWAKLDPAMKCTYEGEPAGTGAAYSWAGNAEVGEGRMTIVESRPNELVRIKLEFLKPFAATNTAEFAFEPQGDQTRVTWSMAGEKTFICKAIHLCMDMDKMVGGQFDQGLTQMKAIVESGKQ